MSVVLDYFGNPCAPYNGEPVNPVFRERCPVCGGTGCVDVGERTQQCISCAGHGWINVERPAA